MIDLTTFVANDTSIQEAMTERAKSSVDEALSGTNETLGDQEDTLEPDSFLLLMAQIISTFPTQDDVKQTETAEIETAGKPISEMNNETKGSENNLDNSKPTTPAVSKLQANVAMAWINSDSFEPPTAVPEVILPPLVTAGVSFEVETSLQPNPEVDKSQIGNALLDNDPESSTDNEHKMSSEPVDLLSLPKSMDLSLKDLDTENLSFDKEENSQLIKNPTLFGAVEMTHDKNNASLMQPINLTETNPNNLLINGFKTNDFNPSLDSPVQIKTLDIPADIDSSQWAERFSEHIIWLESQGIKSALIKLHPEDLGPLEISIKVIKDSASVSISSANNHVRDVVDQALPRLREMMAEQGLNLGDVQIGADSNARQFSQPDNSNESQAIQHHEEEQKITTASTQVVRGLIDYFA